MQKHKQNEMMSKFALLTFPPPPALSLHGFQLHYDPAEEQTSHQVWICHLNLILRPEAELLWGWRTLLCRFLGNPCPAVRLLPGQQGTEGTLQRKIPMEAGGCGDKGGWGQRSVISQDSAFLNQWTIDDGPGSLLECLLIVSLWTEQDWSLETRSNNVQVYQRWRRYIKD